MGLVLLVVIWLHHLRQHLFFHGGRRGGCQQGASAAAASIDHHFTVTYILMGTVFVGRAGFPSVTSSGSIATAVLPRRLHIPTAT